MPKFALLRQFSPEITRSQVDGMALASLATLDSYVYRGGSEPMTSDHGIRWIRSYWEQGGYYGLCLYEAANIEALSLYQDLCNLPFLDATEVTDMPGPTASMGNGDGRDSVAVTFRLDSADEDPGAQISKLTGHITLPDAQLVRTYWNETRRIATALFSTQDSQRFAEQVTLVAEGKPTKIVEITPDEYR